MIRVSSPTPDDLAPPSDGAVVASLAAALGPQPGHVVVTAATAKMAEELLRRVEMHSVAYRCFWLSGRALDPAPLRRALGAQARSARSIGRPVVIIVTEADAAPASELERLRLVVDSTVDTPDVVRLVLLGGPTLLETLRSPALRALATRVTKVVSIPAATIASSLPHTSHVMSEPMRVLARRRPPVRRWRLVTAGLLGAGVTVGAGLLVIAATHWESPPPLRANAAEAVLPAITHDIPAPAREPQAPPSPRREEDLPPPRAVVHPPASPPLRQQIVQVGAFRSLGNATALRDELARTFERVVVTDVKRDGVVWHRVCIEGLTSTAAVNAALTTLRRAGHRPLRVRD